MKKLISLVLALVMVFALAVSVSAVKNVTNDEVHENGTITVSGANKDYNYALYKLLHLHSYNHDNGAYTYVVEDKWTAFFALDTIKGVYVTFDESGYVSWVDGADVAEFAKVALAYAEANDIDPEATSESDNFKFNESGAGGVFSGLTLGYYLVDTSMGALCGLSTAKPDGYISPKNGVPTIDKKVQEDSHVGTGTAEYGKENTADIGQVVKFDITINATVGAQNYVYHDQMSKGLELKKDTVVVLHHYGSTTDTLVEGRDYDLVVNPTDCELEDWNCTFEVVFRKEFLDTIDSNEKLYVRYDAVLTDEAIVGNDGNPNDAVLSYGDEHKTTTDSTSTKTFGFDIFKTDAELKPLQGAQFQLLDENEEVIQICYNKATGEYRRATRLVGTDEEWCNNTITVSAANGVAKVVGLDNGTYYLKETKAPDGYKLLTTNKQFIIANDNLYVELGDDGSVAVGSSVHVENNKGVTLPETGGIGTLLFTVLGSTTALGTGVVLVTKKRMSKVEDAE